MENIIDNTDGNGYGYGYGNGSGYGDGYGNGSGYGDGYGYGNGSGDGDGYGNGSGYGDGYGNGSGYGDGYGYGNIRILKNGVNFHKFAYYFAFIEKSLTAKEIIQIEDAEQKAVVMHEYGYEYVLAELKKLKIET